jgi:hypothetical protein
LTTCTRLDSTARLGRWAWTSSAAKSSPSSPAAFPGQTPSTCSSPTTASAAPARLIRDFHDAVTSFCPPPDARWQALIPAEGTGIIAHHDLAPWNLVISPGHWPFIDRDTAAPGSRLWDVAYALHGFVPLSANPRYQRGSPAHRMRLFADAYGLDQAQRQELLPMLARRAKAMHDFLAGQVATGTQPWTRLWHAGHGRAWRADTDYIAKREDTWRQALLD